MLLNTWLPVAKTKIQRVFAWEYLCRRLRYSYVQPAAQLRFSL